MSYTLVLWSSKQFYLVFGSPAILLKVWQKCLQNCYVCGFCADLHMGSVPPLELFQNTLEIYLRN